MKEFKSSRWTSGNFFFPDRVIVDDKFIRFRKPGFFGSGKDEVMAYEKITSVIISCPIIGFSEISFDCGLDKRVCKGHYKSDVKEMRDMTQKIIDSIRNKGGNNNVNANSNYSTADEILKLKQLLDAGALTQEEFNQQKNKLMNK